MRCCLNIATTLLLALCPLTAAPAVVASDSSPSIRQPRIEFPATEFDFGPIWQNEVVTHVFAFRNTGCAPLRIENVKSSCGCTAAMPEVTELAPGAESTIKITFRSGTFRDRIAKHVYVDSNDPAQPRVTLTIQATVKVEVETEPRGVYFGQVQVGQRIERELQLTPVDVKSFRITEVTSDNPLVQVGKPQPLPDKRPGYRLAITISPFEKPGRLNAKVIIKTDLPHTREIVIAVYGKAVAGDAPAR